MESSRQSPENLPDADSRNSVIAPNLVRGGGGGVGGVDAFLEHNSNTVPSKCFHCKGRTKKGRTTLCKQQVIRRDWKSEY